MAWFMFLVDESFVTCGVADIERGGVFTDLHLFRGGF